MFLSIDSYGLTFLQLNNWQNGVSYKDDENFFENS